METTAETVEAGTELAYAYAIVGVIITVIAPALATATAIANAKAKIPTIVFVSVMSTAGHVLAIVG